MPEQLSLFDDEVPAKDTSKQDKARARAAENAEYVDKRVKASPLVAEAELAKMKELLKPRGGAGSGGTGGAGEIKSLQNPRAMRKGGYVRAADGIAKRGKTKGRLV